MYSYNKRYCFSRRDRQYLLVRLIMQSILKPRLLDRDRRHFRRVNGAWNLRNELVLLASTVMLSKKRRSGWSILGINLLRKQFDTYPIHRWWLHRREHGYVINQFLGKKVYLPTKQRQIWNILWIWRFYVGQVRQFWRTTSSRGVRCICWIDLGCNWDMEEIKIGN